MKDKLLADYVKAEKIATYQDFSIEDVNCAEEWVMFKEFDSNGIYAEQHIIPLIDILAWVYSKVIAVPGADGGTVYSR